MKLLSNLRQHFIPVQPAVKGVDKNIIYREIVPDIKLQPFIYCYWELRTSQDLASSFDYKVVPDGCIDIFFPLEKPDQSYVMGFHNLYKEYTLGHSFQYVGIRFLPTIFPRFFGISADEINNRSEALENVVPAVASFISTHLSPDKPLLTIKNTLDRYFLNHLAQTDVIGDQRVIEAVRIILENAGTISVARDLNTGLSRRQLRRLFRVFVGGAPKSFCKVIRFQYILKKNFTLKHIRKSNLLDDAGYYDQAHFIKEFRDFYGDSPGQVLGQDCN
ncbi:MAG: helix-turn-helix transcriptional regulator [Balneolaceae bacterium]|nr:helix-turn-helix transcriptional regulator [Balneolaceae bacterium]